MGDQNKRKSPPGGLEAARSLKKKKGGNNGKWKTPQQAAKVLQMQRGNIEPGDMGVWVTCARSMEGKAARELQLLFDDYAEKMYGMKPREEVAAGDSDDEAGDIESSIRRELNSLKSKAPGNADAPGAQGKGYAFTPVRLSIDCVLFTKTKPPVEPVEFIHRICLDVKTHGAEPQYRRTRYINRLTPITLMGKANEKAIEDTARQVLAPWFHLKGGEGSGKNEPEEAGNDRPAYSYAIRLSIRHNNQLTRNDVIDQIASLIDSRHKVNLGKPDKTILVEIFQTVCGMSVVGGDWDELRRYNLTELYNQASKGGEASAKEGEETKEVEETAGTE